MVGGDMLTACGLKLARFVNHHAAAQARDARRALRSKPGACAVPGGAAGGGPHRGERSRAASARVRHSAPNLSAASIAQLHAVEDGAGRLRHCPLVSSSRGRAEHQHRNHCLPRAAARPRDALKTGCVISARVLVSSQRLNRLSGWRAKMCTITSDRIGWRAEESINVSSALGLPASARPYIR